MAVPGRKPKPTNLRILEGVAGHRPLNHDNPKPTPKAPTCPTWLEPVAKREWRRVAPELERLGLLTVVDGAALEGYCESYARWVAAEKLLTREGLSFETPNGYVQQRPEVAIAQKYLGLVKSFCAEFGLTPSSRGRMTMPETGGGEEENPFDL